MSKHTTGPWKVFGEITNNINSASIRKEDDFRTIILELHAYEWRNISIEEANANAQRIVDCVNAMEGIEYPKEFMESLTFEMGNVRNLKHRIMQLESELFDAREMLNQQRAKDLETKTDKQHSMREVCSLHSLEGGDQ